MKQIIFLFSIILFFAMSSYAQPAGQKMMVSDASTVYKDSSGNIIKKEKFFEIVNAAKGRIRPVPTIENGKIAALSMKILTNEEMKENRMSGGAPNDKIVQKMMPSDDASIVYKDTSGNIISMEKFEEIFQSGKGRIGSTMELDENGKAKEKRLRVLTDEDIKEGEMRMKETAKDLDAMKGKKAPEFEGKDLDDKNIKLSDLKGKVVVLKFWFVQCIPCIKEMPELNKMMEEKYKNNKDVVFISLCLDGKEAIKKLLEKHPFSYRTLYNMKDAAMNDYKITAYPTHFVIDKNGIVTQASNMGMRSLLEEAIDQALGEK